MKREHLRLGAAIGLGVAAAGVFWYVQKLSTANVVPVLVAARDLEPREVIGAKDLTRKWVPPAAVDQRAIQNEADLIGKTLLSPVYAGEQIRAERITLPDLALAEDEVALAISTDLVNAVGGTLRRGDLVDIYVTLSLEKTRRADVYKVGEAVRVVSVRDSNARLRDNGDDDAAASLIAGVSSVGNPAVVILKVPSDSVAYLKEAAAIGTLTMVKWCPNKQATPTVITPLPPIDLASPNVPGFFSQSATTGTSSSSQLSTGISSSEAGLIEAGSNVVPSSGASNSTAAKGVNP